MKSQLVAMLLGCSLAFAATAGDALPTADSPMTQKRLESVLRALAPGAEGAPGALSFIFDGSRIECISDKENDRMRLIVPIAPISQLTAEQVGRILEANFHTALDARYATSQGYLYAAFIHPLSPLSERELRSAVSQVSSLAKSFGTTYSSGKLVYQGSEPPI